MSESTTAHRIVEALRREAEERLSTGRAPPSSGWAVSAEALDLLYRLASSPNTASDALKLLHELQAYQVELELQQGQLVANEAELDQELARYRGLFEAAPMGYLIIALEGQILEANPAAAELLGVDLEDLPGRPIGSFLGAHDRGAVVSMFNHLRAGGTPTRLEVRVGDNDGDAGAARLVARLSPAGEAILVGITN